MSMVLPRHLVAHTFGTARGRAGRCMAIVALLAAAIGAVPLKLPFPDFALWPAAGAMVAFALTAALLFGLLAVESVKYGHALQISGEVSPTLQIPFFPILYGIAFCSFVVFVVLFMDLLLVITRKEEAWFGWPD